MKTLNQNNFLAFNKSALIELNSQQLRDTDSGNNIWFVLLTSIACYIMSDDIVEGWEAY